MYSILKWIPRLGLAVAAAAIAAAAAFAQAPQTPFGSAPAGEQKGETPFGRGAGRQTVQTPFGGAFEPYAVQTPFGSVSNFTTLDEARDLVNAGLALMDQGKFVEAEKKFREVLRRFPRNEIAPKSDYYLIRTLAKLGNLREAVQRLSAFARTHAGSRWIDDAREFQLQLTSEVPPEELARLQVSIAPVAPPAPLTPVASPPRAQRVPSTLTPRPGATPRASGRNEFPRQARVTDPEVSLQQEILRAVFRNNADRAIEIATERLRSDPSDPVVLTNLYMIAESVSPRAIPMLTTIARSSTNPNARKEAIFWISRSKGEKDSIVDTLITLLTNAAEEESEAVTHALSQVNNDKAMNALAGIARDRNKSEKARNNAIFWIGQSRVPNRVALLEDVYKNSSDNVKMRVQVAFALRNTREPQAVTVLGNIAQNDPSLDVRKQAVFFLGEIRTPEAFQALENLLRKR